MDEAEYCDRIAIINYGVIIALDTPQQEIVAMAVIFTSLFFMLS